MRDNHINIKMPINRRIGFTVPAKQFDARSRYLDIELIEDDGSPYTLEGAEVRFNARKPDGTYIYNDAQILDAQKGLVMVELTDQTLACGANKIVRADISVTSIDGRAILTTRTFEIVVETTMRNDSAVESSNEYGTILNLIQEVRDLGQEMQRRIDEFDAWYASIQQNINLLQIFDFDNRAALDKVQYLTNISGGTITETITNRLTYKKIAERITNAAALPFTERINVYAEDGIRISKWSLITTSIDGQGNVSEVVDGYDDYSVGKAYLSEIRVDGGEF